MWIRIRESFEPWIRDKLSGPATLLFIIYIFDIFSTSVPDQWHFESDPDPWIRTFGYGSGSRSCSFRQWLLRCQQKIFFLSSRFLLITFCRTFTSVFEDRKSLRSHKTAKIMVFFLIFLLVDVRIRILEAKNYGSGSSSGSGSLISTYITTENTAQAQLFRFLFSFS